MTYGALRLRLRKLAPSVDIELIDGWIQDRYTQILDLLPWKRLEDESVIQAPVSYQTGTLTATQGSTSIVGVGTTWTAAMNGLMLRINNSSEYYQFAYVSATTATLDRGFESPTGAALSYRIDQAVFLLPSDCRMVRAVRPLHGSTMFSGKPIEIVTPGDLNRLSTDRNGYGTPIYAAPTWDSFSDPPVMQIEFYPVPWTADGSILSYAIDYIHDQPDIDNTNTGANVLIWLRPAALIAGVQRNIAIHLKDLAAAAVHKADFDELVGEMQMINAVQRGPQQLRIAPELRRRQVRRYGSPYLNRPWQDEGYLG